MIFKTDPRIETARTIANAIRGSLARMGIMHREKFGDSVRTEFVEFVEPLHMSPEELRLEIDLIRMPRGTKLADLKEPKILETLSGICKRPVKFESNNRGSYFVVEFSPIAKVPPRFLYEDLRLPERAHAMTIPIGVGDGGQVWENLRKLPHLLVAGATNQGKSVMVNAILCSLTSRIAPADLRLYLVDLKGGMELSLYEALPHVEKLVTRAGELPQLLLDIQREVERRTLILMRSKCRDIDEYKGSEPLPYILLIIDEIANAMLSRDRVAVDSTDGTSAKSTIKIECERLIADLAARARATGIHLIISTQRPSVDVVTGLIKANFPARIAFGTSSEIDSRVIIDDGAAAGLPKGRLMFRRNMDLMTLQAPLITTPQVVAVVEAITNGAAVGIAPRSRAAEKIGQLRLLLEIAEEDKQRRMPIVRMIDDKRVKQAGIGLRRCEYLVGELASAKILKRGGWGRGAVYRIAVKRQEWESMLDQALNAAERRAPSDPKMVHQEAEAAA